MERVHSNPDHRGEFRVLVDRMRPRGILKEAVFYDLWAKEITPSPELRRWFHADRQNRWNEFSVRYKRELDRSPAMKSFLDEVKKHPVVMLLYAAKDAERNHAQVLKSFIEENL